MSDTPETDAAVISSNGQWSFVLKETCRRLERERDEARRECKFLWDERDEAREQANYWKSQYELEKGLYVIELK